MVAAQEALVGLRLDNQWLVDNQSRCLPSVVGVFGLPLKTC
jgi:hypothetical protein